MISLRARRTVVSLVFVLAVGVTTVAANDVAGSKDSPLLKRYEGSTIVKYSSSAFDAYTLPTGAAEGSYSKRSLPRSAKLEGKLTRLTYAIPPGRSALEVVRNYEKELRSAGYDVLYQGSGAALGNKPDRSNFASAAGYRSIQLNSVAHVENIVGLAEKDDVFVAAKLDRPEGAVHVAVYAVPVSKSAIAAFGLARIFEPDQVLAQVDILEAKPMETRMVTVSASEMSKAIQDRGSVALYGIYFDTNSVELKAESSPTLEEIAKLMQAQPQLRLLVVGHTDSVGTFEANMDLSTRRAHSVVRALTTRHGVDASRLVPVGVSFASPVATNRTDEGRARNRRVQLVEF